MIIHAGIPFARNLASWGRGQDFQREFRLERLSAALDNWVDSPRRFARKIVKASIRSQKIKPMSHKFSPLFALSSLQGSGIIHE
jgi:hypothetical protein